MKYLPSLALGLVVGTALAVGCVDDNRPVVSLPAGGDTASGGDPSSSGGEPNNSPGGSSAQAGEGSVTEGGAAGAVNGTGGQSGEAGATSTAGAGGDSGADAAPFTGPYGAVYVGPVIGVDTRFPKSATWSSGALVSWISDFDEEHDIGSAANLNVSADGGVMQWGRWANGMLGADESNVTLNDQQGFHYAIGQLTPTLPASGTASYEVVGHTHVTLGDGSVASTDLVAAEATASFGATTKVGVTINLTIDGVSYVLVTTGTYATPSTSEFETWDAEHPARLGGIPPQPSQGICENGCSRTLQGFFAGPDASLLAIVVHLFDGQGGSATSISSVIVMKKK